MVTSETETYNDARAGKHLSQTGGGVVGQRPLEVVLWVETRIIVDVRARRLNGAFRVYIGSRSSRGGSSTVFGLGEVVEAWHFQRRYR